MLPMPFGVAASAGFFIAANSVIGGIRTILPQEES